MGRSRAVLAAAVLLIIVVGAGLVRYRTAILSRLTAEGRRERVLRMLDREDILVRRICGLGRVYVDGQKWRSLDPDHHQQAAEALASWCVHQGGTNELTVIDSETDARLGRWDGRAFGP